MDLYQKEFLIYYLKAIFATIVISSIVFLKLLFPPKLLNLKEAKFPYNKILIGLFVVSVAFFYAVFRETNRACTIDTYIGYVIYNVSNLNFFGSHNECSVSASIFYVHFMPGFFLLVPFFKLFSDFRTILFIQSLMVAFGVFPVFWLADRILKDKNLALVFSFAYILHPSVHFSIIWGPHLPLLALVFMLLALCFLFSGQKTIFFISLILFMSWKESLAILVVPLGLYVLIFMKKRSIGLATVFLGMAWFIGSLKLVSHLDKVIPVLWDRHYFEIYWHAILGFLTHPSEFLKFIIDPKILSIYLMLLLSTGFIGLLSPLVLLVACPKLLVICLLPGFRNLWFPYFVSLVPFVILAAILSAKKIILFFEKSKRFKEKISSALAVYILSSSIVSFIAANPYLYTLKIINPRKFSYDRYEETLLSVVKDYGITKEDSVAVNGDIENVPFEISMRKEPYYFSMRPLTREDIRKTGLPMYKYPNLRDADFIIIGTLLPERDFRDDMDRIQDLLWHNDDYGVAGYSNGVLVVKKGEIRSLLDFIQAKETVPSYKVNIIVDDSMELIGYDIEDEYIKRGSRFKITYYWKVLKDINERFRIVSIFNKPGVEEFYWVHTPINGFYPTERWRQGDIIKDEVFVKIPHDLRIVKEPFSVSVKLVQSPKDKEYFGNMSILPDF